MTTATQSAPVRRSLTLDALRCLAAIAVIAQHVSGDGMRSPAPTAAAVLNGLSLWGLPLFFLVSGLVQRRHLIEQTETLRSWTLARIKRLAIPYFAWSAVYIGLRYVQSVRTGIAAPEYNWLAVIFSGGALSPLWFLPMLLYVSVIARAIRPDRRLTAVVLTSVISGVVFIGLAAELLVWDFWLLLPWYLTLYLVGSFIPAAAPFAPYDIRLTLAVFGVLMTFSTLLMLLRPQASVLSITATVLPALAAVTLLVSATRGWELDGQGLLARGAPLLLGVYLSHPGWLLVWQQFMRPETSHWQVWLPLTLLFVSTLAFATSAILLRIPGLRTII